MTVYNRYIKLRKAIRYPDGSIEYIVPFEEKKGELVSQENFESLEDCLYDYMFRWYQVPLDNDDPNTYICEGFAQYYKEVYQKSTDGITWSDFEPRQERKGDLISSLSKSCGYLPPEDCNAYFVYKVVMVGFAGIEGGYEIPVVHLFGNSTFNDDILFIDYFDNLFDPQTNQKIDKNNQNIIITDNNEVFLKVDKYEGDEYVVYGNLKNGMTSFYNMFAMTSLKSADVSNWDTSQVTNMREAFANCEHLTDINGIETWNTSKVSYMNSLFCECPYLTSLNLSGWNLENIGVTSSLFGGCRNLKSIDLSGVNTIKGVSNGMFSGCNSLSHIKCTETLKDWFFQKQSTNSLPRTMLYGTVGGVGSGCNWEITNYQGIGYIFENNYICGGEISSGNPNSGYTYNTYAKYEIFKGYDYSTSQYTGEDIYRNPVLSTDCGFDSSKPILTYKIESSYITAITDALSVDYIFDYQTMQEYVKSSNFVKIDVEEYKTENNYYLNVNLKEGATSMNSMFSGCTNLYSADVSNWDTSQVSSMEKVFIDCSGLTSVNVSNWDVSNVESMYGLFDGCKNLKSLDLTNWQTSKLANMQNMFKHCRNLTSLNLSNFDFSNVNNMRGAFGFCYKLESIDLSSFDANIITNPASFDSMFESCYMLNHIKCKKSFQDWCLENLTTSALPKRMIETGTWEIV